MQGAHRYHFKMHIANMENIRYKFAKPDSTDVWILTTPLTAPVNTMTSICPQKAMETIIIQKPVHILRLPMACSATSPHFYLPPRHKTLTLDVNISLNMANLHMLNISAHDFHIWQHLRNN